MSKHVYVIWTNVAERPGEVEGRYFPRIYRTKTAAVSSINADEIDGRFSPDCREDRETFTRNHKDDGSIELFVKEPNKNLWKSRKFWVKKIEVGNPTCFEKEADCYLTEKEMCEKLVHMCGHEHWNGEDWLDQTILPKNEFMMQFCDWWKLDGGQWVKALLTNQRIVDEHCDWEKLSKDNWRQVLSVRPGLMHKANN